jgi:hypothetical protein
LFLFSRRRTGWIFQQGVWTYHHHHHQFQVKREVYSRLTLFMGPQMITTREIATVFFQNHVRSISFLSFLVQIWSILCFLSWVEGPDGFFDGRFGPTITVTTCFNLIVNCEYTNRYATREAVCV